MRPQCVVWSNKSHSNVQLSIRNGRKRICTMLTGCMYVVFFFSWTFSELNNKCEILVQAPQNPCHPTPCGPNSRCREINDQAVCSCVEGFIGSPPTCRPECVMSSECPQNEACLNQKCRDPCPGTCGIAAKCTVVNHNPICSCLPRFTGDPFSRCQEIGIINNYACIYAFM